MKRRRMLILLTGVWLAAGVWLLLAHSGEPRYEGKTVSYWFREYYQAHNNFVTKTEPDGTISIERDNRSKDAAMVGLRAIGTNALPYLVKEAFDTHRDSTWYQWYYRLLARLPKSWNLPEYVSRERVRDNALDVITEIAPPADIVLPLIEPQLDSTNVFQHHQAISIVARVDPSERKSFLPQLGKALTFQDKDTVHEAIMTLRDIGPEAKPALPELLECLKANQTNSELVVLASEVFEEIGSEAAPAVPLLKKEFEKNQDSEDRVLLAISLCRISERETNELAFV